MMNVDVRLIAETRALPDCTEQVVALLAGAPGRSGPDAERCVEQSDALHHLEAQKDAIGYSHASAKQVGRRQLQRHAGASRGAWNTLLIHGSAGDPRNLGMVREKRTHL